MLDQDRYEHIAIDRRDDGVVLATLNRPDRLNAVNGVLHGELARLPREFDADPDARVLVITGAGRAFCAGGDFSPTGVGQRPGDHARGGPPDRRPPPGVLEAGHLGGQRLRDGPRRHRGPAGRRRLRGRGRRCSPTPTS